MQWLFASDISSKYDAMEFRLPSEAEWEYAEARAAENIIRDFVMPAVIS